MFINGLLVLQFATAQFAHFDLPSYTKADGLCAEHLTVLEAVRKLSPSSAKSMSYDEWQDFIARMRGLLVDPQPLHDLDQSFSAGNLRTRDKFIIKGEVPLGLRIAAKPVVTFKEGSIVQQAPQRLAMEFDWGFMKDVWIPTFLRLLHQQQQDFRSHRLLTPREETLLSGSFPWAIWNRSPPEPLTYGETNTQVISDSQRIRLRQWLEQQQSLSISLEIFDELGNNMESQIPFVEGIHLFQDPLILSFAQQDETNQRVIESLQNRHLPFSVLKPNGTAHLRRAFIRVSAVFDRFFQRLLERNLRSDLHVIIPRRNRDGSWILLGSHFQLQVFESQGQIQSVRFRYWPAEKVQALAKTAPKEIATLQTTVSPSEQLPASSKTPAPSRNGKNDKLYRWHELLRDTGFTNSKLHRFDPLHEWVNDNEAFIRFVIVSALREYALLLEDPDFFERTMTMLRSVLRGGLPDSERTAKVFNFFEQRRRVINNLAQEELTHAENSQASQLATQAGRADEIDFPKSFVSGAWHIPWRDVIREFERAGWRTDRVHGSHYMMKHPQSSKTILLHYQGATFPSIWARQRWREAHAALIEFPLRSE